MSTGKIIATVIVFVIIIFAIYHFGVKKVQSSENYVPGHSFTWKREPVMAQNMQAVAKGDFYSVPGQYQSILNPRFANVDYGANIKYNMPNYENQGVPCEPLTFGNMVYDNYSKEDYGAPRCQKQGTGITEISDDSAQIETPVEYPDATDMVPVGDMNTVNFLGESVQPIVYDRFIYANRNSRLRSLGDPIRGDLPIVPCSASWFRPSVQPNIDLHEGAMNVMGGVNNSTAQELAQLINTTSGDTTIGGVDMSASKFINTNQAMSTVDVVAFP